MLEGMRRNGASVFVYVIFGALIAAFVINFGPQSRGSEQGCSGPSSDKTLRVGSSDLNMSAFRLAFNLSRGGSRGERTTSALHALILRELLAQGAEARGIKVDDAVVDASIKDGYVYLDAVRQDAKGAFFQKVDDAYFFNFTAFKNWVSSLGLTINSFTAQQKREIQASLMADILLGDARASYDEALNDFLYRGNTVTLDAVKFSSAPYKAAIKLSDADVARYLAAHDADVAAKYKTDEAKYKAVKPQVKLRQIFIAKAKTAAAAPTPSGPPAPPSIAAPAAAAKAPAATSDAVAKLTTARTEILAKKATFAEQATALSSNETDKANGGNLGWRTLETPNLGDAKLIKAVKAMKKGDVSDVITTDAGSYLLTIEDTRDGDLSYEQVKFDIARDLARDAWSKEAAHRAAIIAFNEATASGKNLDELYDKQAKPTQMKDLSPEMQKQVQEMMKNKAGKPDPTPPPADGADDDGDTGSRDRFSWESANILASWDADDAVVKNTEKTVAAATAVAAAPTTDTMKPTADVLPPFGDVAKPHVQRVGPIPRTAGLINGIGTSKPMVNALFDELAPGALAKQLYEVDDGYVIVQLVAKDQPKMDEFDKDADAKIARLSQERGAGVLGEWLKTQCDELEKKGKIVVDKTLLRDQDEQGKTKTIPFAPCSAFH